MIPMLLPQTLLPLLLCALPLAAADPLQAVLARIDEAAAGFTGLTANIQRVTFYPVIDQKEEQKGTLVVKRRNKSLRALFDNKEPNPQQIVYTGKQAEIYTPKRNTIEYYDVDKKFGAQINLYLSLGFGATSAELKQSYSISYGGPETTENGQKTSRLTLIPRKPDNSLGLTKVEIWISDETGLAVKQKLYMAGGEYQQATYSNMQVNPNIPDSAVTLKAPKDAKKEYPLK
jgi:outer membrane lipoprotein-sorting protein